MPEEQSQQVIHEEPDKLQGKEMDEESQEPPKEKLLLFSLAALGVVYGDIGTSPLYALRKCFHGADAVSPTTENVLGVLSLIFWSLIIVISIKYLIYVMRAGNEGEGGILALMALVAPHNERGRKRFLVALGIFGAALLYGDGMITPAISVLSAVEGLEVVTDALKPYVIPLTIVILVLLFLFQRRGTTGVGRVFGPVMLVWFTTLGVLGIVSMVQHPSVLAALIPVHAMRFFETNGWVGLAILGGVFLVVTGGEALYADMGHFGRNPIRLAWFGLVLPALVLNYFGQGALILAHPKLAYQPFYLLAPRWALYPLLALAVAATIIASQAVISATFSLTRQAVLLGDFPHMHIVYTSREKMGQVYIPAVNWVMMLATIGLVIGFEKSTNLAGAYGVAVSTTMVITTVLAYTVARERWKWGRTVAGAITVAFLAVDIPFFAANMPKIPDGGWFPILVAGLVFLVMYTWRRGRELLGRRIRGAIVPIETFMNELKKDEPVRVEGTAVFMTGHREGTPALLSQHIQHNKALHKQVVLLTVVIEEAPHMYGSERFEVERYGLGIVRVVAHFGFMEKPDVPMALKKARRVGLKVSPSDVTYYVGRQSLVPSKKRPGMPFWMERLFAFLARNSAQPIAFYELPAERVYEAGVRVEL